MICPDRGVVVNGRCRIDQETHKAVVAEMIRAGLTEIPLIVKEEG